MKNNEKIRKPRQRNHQAIEAIIILDKSCTLQYVSPSIYALLGYQPEELEGTRVFMLLYDESILKAQIFCSELQQQPAMLKEGLLQFRKKNGEKTCLYVQATNLLVHSGVNGIIVQLQHSFRELITNISHPLLIEQTIKINMDARVKARQELAAELHDNVCQSLVGVKLLLDYSLKDPIKNYAKLQETSSMISNLINDVRNLSHTLTVKPSETFELYGSLNYLIANYCISDNLRLVLKFDHNLEDLLQYQQKIHLFRILQEQLGNIIKHAEATKALISLQYVNGKVIATTRDNGRGFEPNGSRSGIGISNMFYRINALEGNMQISSEIGEGTMIKIQFSINNSC